MNSNDSNINSTSISANNISRYSYKINVIFCSILPVLDPQNSHPP